MRKKDPDSGEKRTMGGSWGKIEGSMAVNLAILAVSWSVDGFGLAFARDPERVRRRRSNFNARGKTGEVARPGTKTQSCLPR